MLASRKLVVPDFEHNNYSPNGRPEDSREVDGIYAKLSKLPFDGLESNDIILDESLGRDNYSIRECGRNRRSWLMRPRPKQTKLADETEAESDEEETFVDPRCSIGPTRWLIAAAERWISMRHHCRRGS